MPDVQTPEAVVDSTVVSTPTGTPQEQARSAVYQDYAKLYQQAPEPTVETPVVSETVVTPSTESTPPQVDLQALYNEQRATIEALQAQVNSLIPKPVVVDPTPSTDVKAQKMEAWVKLMADGKYNEAEDYLFEIMSPRLQAKLQPQIVQQSVEATTAERDITNFISTFESENKDLLPLKDYITMGVDKRLTIAQDEGKIKSTADFVREYKAAVTTEAEAMRKTFQLSRAAGAQAAITSHKEVLSATTMEPSGIQQPPAQNRPAAMPSTVDYISQRRERMAGFQGLRQ